VRWNFEKFLVSPNGKPVKRYDASTNPIDIEADIVQLLNQNYGNITQLHH
jgi:glutathione peroxidase